jgi:Dynamin family
VGAAGDTSPLAAALDELSGLAGDDDRATLDALRGRLAGQRLRVLVVGEAKRGKSTLVNALLGRALLPVGVTPLTALATTVRYGRDEGVSAVFRDGRAESFPLSALGDLVTERGNPGNRRNLASVTAVADAPVLARGVELVDTPGTGSVYAHGGPARRPGGGQRGLRTSRTTAPASRAAGPPGLGSRLCAEPPRPTALIWPPACSGQGTVGGLNRGWRRAPPPLPHSSRAGQG